MKWFQNVRCGTSMDPRSYSTDFSFQVAISLTNFYKAKEVAGLMADQYRVAQGQPAGGARLLSNATAAPVADASQGIDLGVLRKTISRDGQPR
jgi:hypothetical protein